MGELESYFEKVRRDHIEMSTRLCKGLGGIPEMYENEPACKLGETKIWMDNFFIVKPEATTFNWMSPDEFLSRVPKIELDEENVKKIFKGISSGRPTSIPFIDVDIETKRIWGHEGRHRMEAFRRLGVKKVPVLAYNWKEDRYARVENSIDELIYPK